jgi:hypothetical protein
LIREHPEIQCHLLPQACAAIFLGAAETRWSSTWNPGSHRRSISSRAPESMETVRMYTTSLRSMADVSSEHNARSAVGE